MGGLTVTAAEQSRLLSDPDFTVHDVEYPDVLKVRSQLVGGVFFVDFWLGRQIGIILPL